MNSLIRKSRFLSTRYEWTYESNNKYRKGSFGRAMIPVMKTLLKG
jgi:hypothetical protein